MRGKKAKKIRKYAQQLMKVHPDIYKDRVKTYPVRNVQFIKNGKLITVPMAPKQLFRGYRLAKKHAALGLKLEAL
jgi:hypothetical protein